MSRRPPQGAMPAEAAAAELLARVLYAEAGAHPARAIEALAALAVNRARAALHCPEARQRYAPGTPPASLARALIAVLRAPRAFLVRHPRHPDHARFAAPDERDRALAVCRRVAQRALAGALPDATGGARLWHGAAALPAWAVGRVPAAECGGLSFYREAE